MHVAAEVCPVSSLVQVHGCCHTALFEAAAIRIPDDAVVLEVGPHAVLHSRLCQCRGDKPLPHIPLMMRGTCAVDSLDSAMGQLWKLGAAMTWQASPMPTNTIGSECEGLAVWKCVFALET